LLTCVNIASPFDPSFETELAADLATVGVLVDRATGDAPASYTPADASCPATRPVIRKADVLSENEKAWLKTRQAAVVAPMRDLLGRLNISGLDTNAYVDKQKDVAGALPVIGIAMSGGGYRALLNGAGAIAAFDIRTPNSTAKGHVGGLLQSATYITGLSGGAWLVGSLFVNNFTTVLDIASTPKTQSATGGLWQFGRSILQGKRE
jgi:lysophospholipase